MADYECCDCGMGVKGIICASCGSELEHASLVKDDGSEVQVSQCPKGCGKIKSPMCCGHDMEVAHTKV
jgi:hypothetical protein